jgi:hypothetical protein
MVVSKLVASFNAFFAGGPSLCLDIEPCIFADCQGDLLNISPIAMGRSSRAAPFLYQIKFSPKVPILKTNSVLAGTLFDIIP